MPFLVVLHCALRSGCPLPSNRHIIVAVFMSLTNQIQRRDHPTAPSPRASPPRHVCEQQDDADRDDAAEDDRVPPAARLDHAKERVDAGEGACRRSAHGGGVGDGGKKITAEAGRWDGQVRWRRDTTGRRQYGLCRHTLHHPLRTPPIRDWIPAIAVRCCAKSSRVAYAWLSGRAGGSACARAGLGE